MADELWNAREIGNILRGYRVRRGYDRMADLCLDVYRRTGLKWNVNTFYEIENGKREPSLSFLTAVILTLRIPLSDLAEAVAPEHAEAWRELIR